MPMSYQPRKFQLFNRKGNSKQHVTHIVETCNNAGINGDLLVKQFVQSLQRNPFDWYIDLAPEYIDSWDQMEWNSSNVFITSEKL